MFAAARRHKPSAACLALALAWASPLSLSQALQASVNTGAPGAVAESAVAGPSFGGQGGEARNTFGDIVRPTVKRKAGAAPYQPIKKLDDDGQIAEIEMFVGESRVFPTPNVARIAVGNGKVLSAAALDDKEVIVFANAVGTSSLFVWNEDGRYQRLKVAVMPGDTSRVAREVAAFLATIPNARASVVGDKVIVEGDEMSDEDREKIADLAKRYPQIVNYTSTIGWEKMVMMDVKVVEFPKSELRELGLKWTANGGIAVGAVWSPGHRGHTPGLVIKVPANGGELPITDVEDTGTVPLPGRLTVRSGVNVGLAAQLNLLEQSGSASILAEPQLSARSGVKASFLAGGEFPYSVTSLQGVMVMFKPYGIKLDIEPRIGRSGIIRAVVESEVSSIDQSVSTAAGPALLMRKTKTEFNARSGETIVLSGLLQRNVSNDVDKVPVLGNIPVLGALFRSKRFQNKETELVVFVTPTIVDSKSAGLVDRVARTTERLSERLDRSPYLSDPLQPQRDAERFNQGATPRPAVPVPQQSTPAGAVLPPAAVPPALGQGPAVVPQAANPLQWPDAARVSGLSGSTLLVRRDGLVLRSAPSDASAALLQLGRGSVVQLGPEASRPPRRAVWRHVVVGALVGWVHASGVTPSQLAPQLRGKAPNQGMRHAAD